MGKDLDKEFEVDFQSDIEYRIGLRLEKLWDCEEEKERAKAMGEDDIDSLALNWQEQAKFLIESSDGLKMDMSGLMDMYKNSKYGLQQAAGIGDDWDLEKVVQTVREEACFMICVDNRGMEDRFEVGTRYRFEEHSEPDMVWVVDGDGKRDEFFGERFAKVK